MYVVSIRSGKVFMTKDTETSVKAGMLFDVCMLYLLFCFTSITPMHVTITVIYFHHVPVMYIARHLDDMSEFPWMSIFWQDILGKSLCYIFDRLYEANFFKKDNGLAIAFKLIELCTSWYHGCGLWSGIQVIPIIRKMSLDPISDYKRELRPP